MSGYDVKRLALILARQAEVEGMKADNEDRRQRGEAMAYDDDDFCAAASDLRELANVPNLQL